MQSFLNQIAQHSIQQYGSDLGELTIVLPNRRAIVFLKEEFKKELNKASWLPQFFSLEDFIQQLGDYTILDSTDLLFKLYNVHKNIEGRNAESLQEFLGWGTTLLQDFNEIDRYLVDAKELFGFLTEAKAIEIWNLENTALTDFQQKYLTFWNQLGTYYADFKAELNKDNYAYQGAAFRSVAEYLQAGNEPKKQFKQMIFAGFNALTKAEKAVIDFHISNKSAEIFWDADEYYLNDSFQEAGNFLRQHKKASKQEFTWISNHLTTSKKNISICGVVGNVGQAKYIGNLIEANKEQETAIVLADESLLTPVLEGLPEEITATNVTMGYPISNASVYSWLELYLNLFLKNKVDEKSENIYHKEVIQFLQHHINQHFNPEIRKEIKNLETKIRKDKDIFVSFDAFKKLNSALGRELFSLRNTNPKALVSSVLQLIQLLRIQGNKKLDLLNQECLAELEKSFNRLERLCIQEKALTEVKSLYEIYKQIVSQQSVSFVGEPLGGLQLMGVLESRTLDFDNIIISNVNEGTLPSGKSQNSFIPFDIKQKFKLPSYQEKDAIFAYHFYRLLQRATNIHILYNTKIDQLEGGERSRFIEQLVHEFETKNKVSTLKEITVAPKTTASTKAELSIPLNQEIRDNMKYKLEHRLSASALNCYLACPLNFYYRYVLKLKEEDTVQEKIEDNVLGNLIHESLKSLYTPLINKVLTEPLLRQQKKEVDKYLLEEYKLQLNTVPVNGNHKLTFEVAKKFINSQIDYDISEVKAGEKLIIRELEQDHSAKVDLKINESTSVKFDLFGKIDRIDERNGKVRIIDYKSGGTDPKDLRYNNITNLLKDKNPKAVQLLLYKYMYWKNTGKEVDSGIISMKNISSGFLSINSPNWKEDFEDLLKIVAQQISSEKLELMHSVDSKYCNFCE